MKTDLDEFSDLLKDVAKIRRDSYKHADPAKGEKVDPSKEYHRGFTEGIEYIVKLIATIQSERKKHEEHDKP